MEHQSKGFSKVNDYAQEPNSGKLGNRKQILTCEDDDDSKLQDEGDFEDLNEEEEEFLGENRDLIDSNLQKGRSGFDYD